MRRLTKIDLWEISVVTFPMQPEARIAAVKTDSDHALLAAIILRAARMMNASQ